MGRIIIQGGGNNVDLDIITAAASDVLKGKVIIGPDGEPLTGTIPSLSARTITPGTGNQVLNAGNYLAGNITVAGDSDLVSPNIAQGKNIFGINGSAKVLKTKTGYVDTSTSKTSYKDIGSAYTITLNNIGFTPAAFAFISTDTSPQATMWCEGMYSTMGDGKGVAVSGFTGTMGYATIDGSSVTVSKSTIKVPFWYR